MSSIRMSEGISKESEEYFPLNENYYDILDDCKSLLTENKMDFIRIIFKEIVDVQSIKRQIYIMGVVDIPNKILYSQFLNLFLDYISELDSFITLPKIFQQQNITTKNHTDNKNDMYDKVFYVNSSKRQSVFNINGNKIFFEDLLEKNGLKKDLKLLIFWKDISDIDHDINEYLNLARNYNKYLSVIFISDKEGYFEKKTFLQENKYYKVLDPDNLSENENANFNDNIYFVFDENFLHNKYYVIKFPWFIILNKNNDIFDSGILWAEEIQGKIENFLGENPQSGQNINNLFWIDLSNKIKLNLVRKINLKLAKSNYKNIYFYIETNVSVASDKLMSSFNIDAYFFGSLKFQDFKIFKEFAEKICKEEKIKNIHFNIEK